MRLIHRYLLAAVLMVAAGAAAMAQTRDDRYSGVTGTIPPAAVASPAGGPDWSGESGSSGDPRMTAAAVMRGSPDEPDSPLQSGPPAGEATAAGGIVPVTPE